MATSQTEKANRFRALHERCFVIANAWDAGSARILAGVGFAALATSSGAAAGMLGRRDGMITREESLVHARTVAEATDLPVSADLEKGFGDSPMRLHRRLRWPASTAWSAARSRMPPAIRRSRCSILAMRRNASLPPLPQRARHRSASC